MPIGNSSPSQLARLGSVTSNFSHMKDISGGGEKFFQRRISSADVFDHPNSALPNGSATDGAGPAGTMTGTNDGPHNLRGGVEIDFFGRLQFWRSSFFIKPDLYRKR